MFCGTLTAGELEVAVVEGKLSSNVMASRRSSSKPWSTVHSGPYAAENGKDVLYITERCVFRLTKEGLELIEIAPGVDIKRDILDRMDFEPIIRRPRAMDPRIFRPEPMGLRDDILQLPFDARFSYDEQHNILFLNFSELRVKSSDDIERLKGHIQAIVEPLGHKVYAVVNYDGFDLAGECEDEYLEQLREVGEKYFHGVTRFTTSAFMRAKLGDQLEQARGGTAHIRIGR